MQSINLLLLQVLDYVRPKAHTMFSCHLLLFFLFYFFFWEEVSGPPSSMHAYAESQCQFSIEKE